ncbi:hypothetical protein M407DRAFT_8315 [Tulasnella calospora MUT 4182]|uniref:Uncharacterized protein n=1 Tax=Tulasnella calospora MUT 4182 TaxID=1051891 RepID=A0A0C3QI45_9AGAM|nr:hypothetical protein M407DRAFT_8315 [Tulasnella calospora MUT 4182]
MQGLQLRRIEQLLAIPTAFDVFAELRGSTFAVKVTAYVTSLPVGFQTRREVDGTEYTADGDLETERLTIPVLMFSFDACFRLSQIEPPEDEIRVQAWVGRLGGKAPATLPHLIDPHTAAYNFPRIVSKVKGGEKSDLCWQLQVEDERWGNHFGGSPSESKHLVKSFPPSPC